MMIEVLLLLGLMFGVLCLAWKYEDFMENRAMRARCPICQGADKQAAFKDGNFMQWCPTHRDTWYEATSIWVK